MLYCIVNWKTRLVSLAPIILQPTQNSSPSLVWIIIKYRYYYYIIDWTCNLNVDLQNYMLLRKSLASVPPLYKIRPSQGALYFFKVYLISTTFSSFYCFCSISLEHCKKLPINVEAGNLNFKLKHNSHLRPDSKIISD